MLYKKHLLIILLQFKFFLPFATAQITPDHITNLILWLKADSNVILTGSFVNQWLDCSPMANNAVQSDANRQPEFVQNAIRDYPVLRFSGDDFLILPNNALPDQNHTIFIVARTANNSENKCILGRVYNYDGVYVRVVTNLEYSINSIVSNSINYINNNTFFISSFKYNSVAQITYISPGYTNTVNNSIGQITYNINDAVAIGAAVSTSGSYAWPLTGDIAEIIIYNRALTSQEDSDIINYLRTKYAGEIKLNNTINIPYGFCDTVLHAGNGFKHYIWSTGNVEDTLEFLTIAAPGMYKVTVTDYFGYTSTDSVEVFYPQVNLNQGDSIICLGDSISISSQLSGMAGYQFLWSTGETTPEIVVSSNDTISVIVSDTLFCNSIESVPIFINIDSLPAQVDLGEDRSICAGSILTLEFYPEESSQLLFNWSDLSNDSTITVFSSGDYSVTITNQLGCFGIDTVHLNVIGTVPYLDFFADTACFGQETSLLYSSTFSPDSLLWNFGDGQTETISSCTHVYPNPGSYQCQLKLFFSNCEYTISKQIIVNNIPHADFTSTQSCVNHPVFFTNTSAAMNAGIIDSVVWNMPDSFQSTSDNPNYTFTTGGLYPVSLIVYASNGCSDTIIKWVNTYSSTNTPNISPQYPLNNSFIINNTIQFDWTSAFSIYHILQIASDSLFNNLIFEDTIANNYITLNLNTISNNQTVFWRIIGVNFCMEQKISDFYSFTYLSPSEMPSCILWLAADSGVVKDNNNNISEWLDLSSSNNAIQIISNRQPLYIQQGLYNNPVIRFDGDDFFILPNEAMPEQNHTIFIVARSSNSTAYKCILGRVYTFDGFYIRVTSNIEYSINSVLAISNEIQNNNIFSLSTYKFNSSTQELKVTPNSYTTINNNNSLINYSINDAASIGAAVGTSGSYAWPFIGDIAEIIIFNQALSTQETNIYESYLMDKYAPPVNLGADIHTDLFCPITIEAGERFTDFAWNNGSTDSAITVNQSGKYWVQVTDIFGRVSSDTVLVYFPERIQDTVLCAGDSVEMEVPFTGNYIFEWSNGDSLTYTTYQTGGIHWLEIIDDSLCSRRDTFLISVDSIRYLASLGPDTSLCSGNFLALSAGQQEAVGYSWAPGGETSSSILLSASGNYAVTVTSANSCTATDSIYINIQGVAPVASFTTTNQCFGDSLVLTDASYSLDQSNVVGWEWEFHDGQTAGDSVVKKKYPAPGIYPVTLTVTTDSACSSSSTLQVQVHHLPEPSFEWSNPCSDKPIQFINTSQVQGGAQISDYLWIVNGTDSFDVAAPLYYANGPGMIPVYLSATSSYGCTNAADKIMEVKVSPVAQFEISPSCTYRKTYFFDQSVAPVYHPIIQWDWDLGISGVSSSYQNPEYTYYQPGNYPVSLNVKSLNGCSDEYVRQIQVSSSPVAGFSGNEGCVGTPLLLTDSSTVVNGYVFSRKWTIENAGTFSDSLVNLLFTDSGHYTLTLEVVSELNCKAETTGVITIHPLPVADFTVSSGLGSAPLEVTFINQSDEGTCWWDFGDGETSVLFNPVHIFTDTGYFSVNLMITDSNGCVKSAMQGIRVVPSLYDIAILGMDTIVNGNIRNIAVILANIGTLPVENPYIVVNLPNSQPFTETVNLTLQPGTIHYYIMTTGILASDIIDRSFICAKITLPALYGPEENQSNNEYCLASPGEFRILRIYPNPASNQLVIEVSSENNGQAEMIIQSPSGKRVTTEEITVSKGLNRIYLDISNYAQGMYFVSFTYKDDKVFGKFVKSGGTK